MTDLYQWTTLLLPVISAIVAWFLGRRQRTHDNLEMLQSTIDKLLAENTGLYSQIMKLRQDNASLSNDMLGLRADNAQLRDTIAQLQTKLEIIGKSIKGTEDDEQL